MPPPRLRRRDCPPQGVERRRGFPATLSCSLWLVSWGGGVGEGCEPRDLRICSCQGQYVIARRRPEEIRIAAMESLSASRLRKVLQVTAQAVEFRELSEFRAGAGALVRELVPCESASYNELKPGTQPIVVADPHGWISGESLEIFDAFAGENPLIAHYARTGDGQPVRFSDFLSRRRLHSLTLYDQLYRPLGIEHQIAFVLPSAPGEMVGIALNRERHDFTDEEAAMLAPLRAPMRSAE